MEDEEFYIWLAGFFEGEGCLSFSNTHPQLTIHQSGQRGKKIMNMIKEKVGYGHVYYRPKGKLQFINKKYRKNSMSSFAICKIVQIQDFISKILPHMQFRRDEIENKMKVVNEKAKNLPKSWSEEENDIIFDNWNIGDEELGEIFKRTKCAVRVHRNKLGITYFKKVLKHHIK